MSNAPAGWYPDAEVPGGMRYWDGALWTEHRHMPAPAPVPGAVPPPHATPQQGGPRKRRTGLVLGLVGGGAALVLGIVAIFAWGIPAWTYDEQDLSQMTTRAIVHSDEKTGYDYTEPVSGIEDRTQEIVFRTSFDPYTKPEWADPDDLDNAWAFEVFADAALSIPAPAFVTSSGKHGGFSISSYENVNATIEGSTEEYAIRHGEGVQDGRGGWGLRDTYYLVRYIDAGGSKLERPVVSQFSFVRDLDVPEVVLTEVADSPGTLGLSWQPVEGAEGYLVIKTGAWAEFEDQRDYEIIGQTEATSWTGDEAFDPYDARSTLGEYGYDRYQNYALEFFRSSEDDALSGFGAFERNVGNEYAVVAFAEGEDGDLISPLGTVKADDLAAALPYTVAENAFRELNTGEGYWRNEYASVDQVPAVLPLVNLGGTIVPATAQMSPTPLRAEGGRYVAAVVASGTKLGFWVAFRAGSDAEFAAAVESFNARAKTDALPTGKAASFIREIAADTEPVAEAPATDLPIREGSHPFVDFLAQHFVGGTRVIDLSAWVDRPGLPDIYDAAYEALLQTGWSLVDGISLSGDTLAVEYHYSTSELAERQQAIADEVDAVIGEIIDDGMSDAEKVTAINAHLTSTVEYDYEALDAANATLGMPSGYEYAWTAEGALLDGLAVCQGYSVAFMLLARAAGLDAVQVTGRTTGSESGHAWNKVEVDGEWVAVDVTWNDSSNPNQYLMITDSQFTGAAERYQDADWMIDLDIPSYATAG